MAPVAASWKRRSTAASASARRRAVLDAPDFSRSASILLLRPSTRLSRTTGSRMHSRNCRTIACAHVCYQTKLAAPILESSNPGRPLTQCMVRPCAARASANWRWRSCINVSGLRLKCVLRAIMDISAPESLLADRPHWAIWVANHFNDLDRALGLSFRLPQCLLQYNWLMASPKLWIWRLPVQSPSLAPPFQSLCGRCCHSSALPSPPG